MKIVAGEGKKNAKFWAPHPSGPHPSGPTLRGPTLRDRPRSLPPFHGSRTCSRVGSSAQVHVATTSCELCPLLSLHTTRLSTMRALLGDIPGGDREKQDAARLATLPLHALGFRSAVRMAPGAPWASWADALPMLQERLPIIAQNAVNVLDGDANVDGCLGEVCQAAAGLDRQGFIGRPQWGALQMGARPSPPTDSEPGEWAHGWERCAAAASEFHFWKSVVFAQSCPSHQLISAHTQAVAVPMCFMGFPPDPSSRLNQAYSAC